MNSAHQKLIKAVRAAAIDRFIMPRDGIHGPSHWERVAENAEYLSSHTGADPLVTRLFSYLHDCCRESDGSDARHGARAAEFALTLRDSILTLSDDQFELLSTACEYHERGRTSRDPTVGACWDADRLDLGRVGIRPNPTLLSTQRARLPSVIEWAYKRSRGHKAKLKA